MSKHIYLKRTLLRTRTFQVATAFFFAKPKVFDHFSLLLQFSHPVAFNFCPNTSRNHLKIISVVEPFVVDHLVGVWSVVFVYEHQAQKVLKDHLNDI